MNTFDSLAVKLFIKLVLVLEHLSGLFYIDATVGFFLLLFAHLFGQHVCDVDRTRLVYARHDSLFIYFLVDRELKIFFFLQIFDKFSLRFLRHQIELFHSLLSSSFWVFWPRTLSSWSWLFFPDPTTKVYLVKNLED